VALWLATLPPEVPTPGIRGNGSEMFWGEPFLKYWPESLALKEMRGFGGESVNLDTWG